MRKLLWVVTWLTLRPLLKVFCSFEIRGVRNLENLHGPLIVAAATHANRLDPWIISAAIPLKSRLVPIRFITAEKYFKIPLVSLLIKAYYAYPVTEGLGAEVALQSSVRKLQEGQVIGIFPEGKLSRDGVMSSGKRGVAYLSKATGVPVLPVSLSGSYKLSVANLLLRRNKIKVVFGQPYVVKENDLISATDYLMQKIKDMQKQNMTSNFRS